MSNVFIGDIVTITDSGECYDLYTGMADFLGLNDYSSGPPIDWDPDTRFLVVGKSYHPVQGDKRVILGLQALPSGRGCLMEARGVSKVSHILEKE